MDAYLPPLDQPKGLYRKLAFFFVRRQFGKVIMSIRVVASEHLNNMTNIGLGIGSDGLCELARRNGQARGDNSYRATR